MNRSARNVPATDDHDDAPTSRPEKRRQFRVVTPIDRTDERGKVVGTFWQPLGRAFENDAKDGKGASISVMLNALPVSAFGGGELRIVLFEDDGERRAASES